MVYRLHYFSTEKNIKFYSKIQAMVHSDLMSLDIGCIYFSLPLDGKTFMFITEMLA